MLSARCPGKAAKNGGSITLSTKWARNDILWKIKIAQIVLEHNIHEKMILNLLEAVLPKTVKR